MLFIFADTNLQNVEALNSAVDDVVNNPSIIKTWLETLPQKGFDLAIRSMLCLVFLIIGILLSKILRKIVNKAMARMNADVAAVSFVDSVIKIICYSFIVLFILVRFGVDAASIVAVIGSMGLTAGMAIQGALQNFAGGLILLFIKPFAVGDFIHENSKGYEGNVTDIGLLYTEITTIDNRLIYIPNGVMANSPIDNFTANPVRVLNETVQVSYNCDTSFVKKVIVDVLNNIEGFEVSNTIVFIDKLDASGISFRFRTTIKTEEFLAYKSVVFENIKNAFDKNGIEIPYNQLDVHMR